MEFIQSKGKRIKGKLRLKDEIRARMVHFPKFSSLSSNFAKNIVANPRCILRNWRKLVFLKGQYKANIQKIVSCFKQVLQKGR